MQSKTTTRDIERHTVGSVTGVAATWCAGVLSRVIGQSLAQRCPHRTRHYASTSQEDSACELELTRKC